MSKLVQVNKVIADGTSTSVLLDGIDSDNIYYYTFAGVKHDDTLDRNGIIHAHDGTSNVTTNYQGRCHGWRSDTTDSILDMSASANEWLYGFAWSISAGRVTNGDGYLFNFNDALEYSYIKSRFANQFSTNTMLGGNGGGVVKNTAQYSGISFSYSGGVANITGEFTLFKLLEV
jgi:hypothetical protein